MDKPVLSELKDLSEEMTAETEHGCHIVQLIPYKYQVGGHDCLLTYDEKTVCKPLNKQEHKVYNYLPEELREFTPRLYGVVKVYFEKCGDEILCFALPLDCSYCKDTKRLKNYLLATNALSKDTKGERSYESKSRVYSLNMHGCSLAPKEKLHSRWKRYYSCKELDDFILLENISKYFKYPCTIDLKMGTRGYGDFCSQEKILLKKERVDRSTSRTLGVRFCGMQVYHPSTDKYVFTDKYSGRLYSDDELKKCIRNFLYNGSFYRIELLPTLIRKLKTLLKHLQSMDGYRFYCSSLLLMYDGLPTEHSKSCPEVEVRMIDFAHARHKEEETNHHIGPDRGFILGVCTLIDVFTELLAILHN